MKILILNHNLREHGTYFRALEVAKGFARRGHHVTYMTVSPQRWYRSDVRTSETRLTVIETPSWSWCVHPNDGWGPLSLMRRLWEVIKIRYDLVYSFSHHPVTLFPALFSRIVRRSRMWVDWCDWFGKGGINTVKKQSWVPTMKRIPRWVYTFIIRMEDWLEKFAARSSQKLTVISSVLKDRALQLGVNEERIHVFFSGADLDSIRREDMNRARKELGFEENERILGYIGNFHPDEALLLNAFSRVVKRHPDVKLLSVGTPFNAKQSDLKHLGIDRNLIQVGRKDFSEMSGYLGACDILLLPLSDSLLNRARWPNKIGDYLAAGRPVVACGVGDITQLFQLADIGALSQPDATDFAQKTHTLLDAPHTWEERGHNARHLAETVLSWNHILDNLAYYL